MRYPMMSEHELALRWKVSLKSIRRWRQAKTGADYRTLFNHARYAETDVVAFERRTARHWLPLLGRAGDDPLPVVESFETTPTSDGTITAAAELGTSADYVSVNEAAAITSLPMYFLKDRAMRDRLGIPYLKLVGVVRFSIAEIYKWELANSRPAFEPPFVAAAQKVVAAARVEDVWGAVPDGTVAPRWYTLVRR